MGCHSQDQVTPRLWFLSCSASLATSLWLHLCLSVSLSYSICQKSAAMLSVALGKGLHGRNWSFCPMTSEALSLPTVWVSLEVILFWLHDKMPHPQWPQLKLWRDLEPENPAKPHPYSWPRKRWIINACYFMLLNFESSCYMAIDICTPYISLLQSTITVAILYLPVWLFD